MFIHKFQLKQMTVVTIIDTLDLSIYLICFNYKLMSNIYEFSIIQPQCILVTWCVHSALGSRKYPWSPPYHHWSVVATDLVQYHHIVLHIAPPENFI